MTTASTYSTLRRRIALVVCALAMATAACSSASADTEPAAAANESNTTIVEPTAAAQAWTAVASFDRLHHTSDDCVDVSLVASDGTADYATVADQLVSRDLVTGEVTNHGPPPTACAVWIEDTRTGLRLASADDAQHLWFAAPGQPWTVEKAMDAPAWLLKSQTTASGRWIFINEPGEVILRDALTGEPVGVPVGEGRFQTVDNSLTSPYVALGFGSPDGNGLLLVLDDETGEEVYRITTDLPPQALTFDDANKELIAGLAGGKVITVDLNTGNTVAEAETTAKTSFLDIGLRPDGLVVAVSNGQIDLVDRRQGSVSAGSIGNGHGARIRPDGTPLVITDNAIDAYSPSDAPVDTEPAEVSLDAEFLSEQVAKVDVIDGAGAFMVAVVDEDGSAIHASAGSDADGDAPRPSDVFRVGSITKIFTAAATLTLVDEGLVDLDAPAADFVTRVQLAPEVTVRDLLRHTSGIPNYTNAPGFHSLVLDDLGRTWEPEESVNLVASDETQFEPGTQFRYSNTNYIILGILIEEVTGKPYHQVVRDRIIDPLSMTSTYLAGAEDGPELFDAYTSFRGSPELIEFDYTAIETGAWAAGAMS